jgi:transcriptional regulator with XRE-family HTH domain
VQPLRAWRTQQMMSMKDLADTADVSPQTLLAIEHGRRLRPNYAVMRRISQALGVEPSEIAEFAAAVERYTSVRPPAGAAEAPDPESA